MRMRTHEQQRLQEVELCEEVGLQKAELHKGGGATGRGSASGGRGAI